MTSIIEGIEHRLDAPVGYSKAEWRQVVRNDLLAKGMYSATYRADYVATFKQPHPRA